MTLNKIYNKLDMTPEKGLCVIKENNWKKKLPKRLQYLIEEKLKPEAFFCFNESPLVLFYDSPQNKENLFKAIWNFNESPIVIINEPDVVEIYNGFSYLKDTSTLEKLDDHENLKNFSYFELVTGKTLEQYHAKLKQQSRVDFNLLENVRDARTILIKKYGIKASLANMLIGKCIFVRYLIDRGVEIKFEKEPRKWKNEEFCELFNNKTKLINFFAYLRNQFNGEGFLRNDSKLQDIPKKAYFVLKDLLMGTELSSGQRSLFDIYDFSIIPVEFISNVYEFFIGKEKQAEEGAYYTPKFLVDYILSQTVEKHFKEFPKQYNCKVLDPACGSGIFLVEALRRIVEHYIDKNNRISKKSLKKLAENNIFGIDKDENAINVAIFSIYLALLDYQEPKDIENFTFPDLLRNGNFHAADFFDTSKEYNKIFSEIDFNFIIGNPPWKRSAPKSSLFINYIRKRKKIERKVNSPEIHISNNEIAQAFLLRTSDFNSKKTKCALIVTSKALYNLNAKKFREYFLHNFFIEKVFELAPVRREVFDKSNYRTSGPAAILFFRYSHEKDTTLNELTYICLKPNRLFSLFKIFILQKADIKKVLQKRLMKYDWLWKVLVYGSYLDFNFIKRLNGGYLNIRQIIDKKDYLDGQGLQYGQDKISAKALLGYPFIESSLIEPFFLNTKGIKSFQEEKVHRIRNPILYEKNKLLIKKGATENFNLISAISYSKGVFKDTLTAIKVFHERDINDLRIISGLLSSKMFSYFILQTGSSIGIEREQVHNKKFTFPYIDKPELAKLVNQIEMITKKIHKEREKPLNPKVNKLKSKRQKYIYLLNRKIFESFDLNEQELALVNYAVAVTIPLIMKHDGYMDLFSSIPFKNKLLKEYIEVFFSRFQDSFKEKHLKAEVWHTTNIVGIFFKVIEGNLSDKKLIEWKKEKDNKVLKKIISLGTTAITESLFIQKDIRGFEKNSFYIIKPNEKKLWHKANAYLDVNKFVDALLRVGQE